MTPLQFAKRMDEVAKNVEKTIGKAIVSSTLKGFEELAARTPVDVGTAVSNWKVSLNEPAKGVRKAYSPGRAGSTAESNASAAVVAASRALGRYSEGDIIYITNNVPYMERLNDGYSLQAPAGFVESALSSIRARIRAAKIVVTF